MFGKPEWFRKKIWGWGLVPATWQGWLYTAVWCAVMVIPFNVLLAASGAVEALIWMLATIAALVWDVRHIHAAIDRPGQTENVLYIGDDEEDSVRTKRLDLRLRR